MQTPPWVFLSSVSLPSSKQQAIEKDGMRIQYDHLRHRRLEDQYESCTQIGQPSSRQNTEVVIDSGTTSPVSLVERINSKPTITVTVTTTIFSDGSVTSTMSQGEKTPSSTQSTAINPSALQTSVEPAVNGSINDTSGLLKPAQHAATITGATLGSMAFVGLIGALLWFCCFKSRSRREKVKEQIKLKTIVATIRRRKSTEQNMSKLKNQKQQQDDDQKLMEETRAIMLKQKSALRAVETGNESQANLIIGAVQPGMSSASSLPCTVRQEAAQTKSAERLGEALAMPAPLFHVSHEGSTYRSSSSISHSTVPGMLPRKPVQVRPAPILTTPQHVYQPERLSPLSPRSMFNAVSGAVKRLSPGGSSRGTGFANDGRGGFEALSGDDGKHGSSSNGSSIGRTKSKLGKWI